MKLATPKFLHRKIKAVMRIRQGAGLMGDFSGRRNVRGLVMWEVATVNEALLKVSGRGDAVVWQWQDRDGAWKEIPSAEVYGRAQAGALAEWGVGKGDRVALLSEVYSLPSVILDAEPRA